LVSPGAHTEWHITSTQKWMCGRVDDRMSRGGKPSGTVVYSPRKQHLGSCKGFHHTLPGPVGMPRVHTRSHAQGFVEQNLND
jgi:hypothetical protein